jgi:hypothetical protein
VVGEAFWDEYVPTKIPDEAFDWIETGEVWKDSGKPKMKKVLRHGEATPIIDPGKTGWIKGPRNQIAKCAEAQAHRRGWPNDFAGVLVDAEVDRTHTIDLSASEMADQAEQAARLDKIGGPGRLIVDWMNGGMLDAVPVGQFFDRAAAFIVGRPADVQVWGERNRHTLQEFWALQKSDALELKRAMEKAIASAKHCDPDAVLSGKALAEKLCKEIAAETNGDKREGILVTAQDARDAGRLSPELYRTVMAAYHAASGDEDEGAHERRPNGATVPNNDPMFAKVMA